MKLRRFETPGIAHYAYLLADGDRAAIVDPRRDVDEYLDAAREEGVRIDYVIETHRQEDFVMGAAHLAARTGARIVNGRHDLFGHGDVRLGDGEEIELGSLRLRALHTPGHTPESVSWAVYAPEQDDAWAVFTGDALFFGDTGRTDLPDPDRTAENAALLYDMVHEKIAPLGEGTLVLPAHGPGSVCGAGMAARPFSTIAAERGYNVVFTMSRDEFAKKKAAERIPRPPYFRLMEKVNLEGGMPPAGGSGEVPLLSVDELADRIEGRTVIDARPPEAFAGAHVPGAYGVWMGGLPVFGGWIASHETPVLLVLDDDGELETAVSHLSRIGIDRVAGSLAGGFSSWYSAGRPIERAGIIAPRELAEQRDGIQVLDVREDDEHDEGHIAGATHCYVGYLEDRVDALGLDPQKPVAVTCSIGNRSGLAVSILQRHGYRDVRNVLGGMTAWKKLGLPTERG